MYTVTVRDHCMIAHSLKGDVFGPAQQLHGATFVVDVEFRRTRLDPHGIVVDMGRASSTLHAILAEFNYRNLDQVPAFAGRNSTTENLAREIFDRLAQAAAHGDLGEDGRAIEALKVTLHESHVASASFEGPMAS